MVKKPHTPQKGPLPRWYRGADVPMRVIRRFARQVAERFDPDKMTLQREGDLQREKPYRNERTPANGFAREMRALP